MELANDMIRAAGITLCSLRCFVNLSKMISSSGAVLLSLEKVLMSPSRITYRSRILKVSILAMMTGRISK